MVARITGSRAVSNFFTVIPIVAVGVGLARVGVPLFDFLAVGQAITISVGVIGICCNQFPTWRKYEPCSLFLIAQAILVCVIIGGI